ncbi:MAG: S41 family peptidase [Lachnospiraceae bacterium]|nr:S41 family peptidase [Lachnospiraceae bacterium]
MNNKISFWAGLITGLITALSLLILVFLGNGIHNLILGRGFSLANNDAGGLLTDEVRDKLYGLNEMIDENYVNYKDDDAGMSASDRAEGLYKGLVSSLNDPYSQYYTEREYRSLMDSVDGSFEGIGASIGEDPDTGEYNVVGFTEGSPAEKAGMQVEDIFFSVNGVSVAGMDLDELVSNVRGPKGSSVTLVMLRGDDRQEVTLEVVRDSIITAKTVSVNMIDSECAYMQITNFEEITEAQFEEGLSTLKTQGMKKLLLDLRGNPGGSMEAAINISDKMLPEGLVVYTVDAKGNKKEFNSTAAESLDLPIVVLVDENTGSAAEILAGALKDHKRATLLGVTTYGKGIVQNVYGLKDGSALKLTAARYYTPSGVNIQGIGIEPDVTVEWDAEAYERNGYDNQLEEGKKLLKKM